jgi:hypothetical protein
MDSLEWRSGGAAVDADGKNHAWNEMPSHRMDWLPVGSSAGNKLPARTYANLSGEQQDSSPILVYFSEFRQLWFIVEGGKPPHYFLRIRSRAALIIDSWPVCKASMASGKNVGECSEGGV